MNFYISKNNDEDKQLLQAFNTHTQLHNGITSPYINGAGVALLKQFVDGFHHGITVTCPGFYGPQGRVLRMGISQPDLIDKLTTFTFGRFRITNFEMETSALYGMGKVLGHQCLSVSAIVANRITREFTKDGDALVDRLISKSLEIISTL